MSKLIQSEIEYSFGRLSASEQLGLLERLTHQVNKNSLIQEKDLANQLALMASDPEIQSEIHNIEWELAYTENDGLETV